MYSLPSDHTRPETSICLDYPGKKELKQIDNQVDLLEEMDYSKYGLHGVIITGITCKGSTWLNDKKQILHM